MRVAPINRRAELIEARRDVVVALLDEDRPTSTVAVARAVREELSWDQRIRTGPETIRRDLSVLRDRGRVRWRRTGLGWVRDHPRLFDV